MKKILTVCLLSSSFWLLLPIFSVSAVGIGVKPKEVNLEVKVGQEVKTELLMMNVSAEPAIYQIYPDGLESIISISPTDFGLEPNANQIITLTIKAKTPGRFATNISAVARPLGAGGLPAALGAKIPITITASGVALWQLILGAAVGGCLIIFFVLKLIKRKKPNINQVNLIP